MTASTAQRPAERERAGAHGASRRRVSAPAAGWVLLGLASSVVLMVTGGRLTAGFHWWLRPAIHPITLERAIFYAGMAGLVIAWLGLARVARAERHKPRWVAAVAFIWCLPLLVGPPLFSHDIYSYLAQGTIAHLGLSPYRYTPVVLGRLGHPQVLQAVDPFWRRATAPYGPLFLGIISLIVGLTGSNVVAGVVLIRLFDLIGLVLLAVFVPRLARRMGTDPVRAVWLAVASPLILLQLVAPGHNDLLMAGMLAMGVAVATEGRPLLGIAVCMLAATIKLPAVAGAVFIAVAWLRAAPSWRVRAELAAKAIAVAVAVAAAVTLVTGFGVGWISTSLFSTPGKVRLAVTPATDISFTIAKLGSDLSFHDVEPVLRTLMLIATVLAVLALLGRTRWRTLIPCLGLALIAAAIGGPALWPWYLAWGLALLAAWKVTQNSRVVVIAIIVASFLVKPDGILLLSRGSSPVVAVIWVLIAAAGVLAWRRRTRPTDLSVRRPMTP